MKVDLAAIVPAELRSLAQWVGYKLKRKGKKLTKVPFCSHEDREASVTDATTWGTFEAACAAVTRFGYSGVGFVVTEDDPYTGIDFDACVVDGVIEAGVWEWVLRLNSYAEFSPSGTGVRVFVRGRKPGDRCKHTKRGIEIYDHARFFTTTGRHIEGTPLSVNDAQVELDTFYVALFGKTQTRPAPAERQSTGNIPAGDEELLRLMLASRNGDKIRGLWNGDISGHSNDHSSADQALCNYLAFWTANDAARMDRLFRQSGLYRDKWERESYRIPTLNKAIANTTEVYQGAGPIIEITHLGTPMSSNGAHPGHEEETPHIEAEQGDDEDSKLLEWAVHDHGNASVVNALHPDAFAFCDALGWMANDGTHYETENAERMVNRAITKTLIRRRMAAVEAQREDVVKGTAPSSARKNAVKDMFKDLVVVKVSDFDRDPNVLNCANGVIDLRTGQIVTHGASDKFTYCVPTPYIPAAKSELWCRFLSESVGDYDQITDWLQMSVGYSITGLTREEILYYIEGPTRSGKGTFEHAKLTMLGSPLARGVDFNTFTSKREGDSQNFDLAPLRAARLLSASESGRYSSLNESVVKNITGNDPITAAFKYHDPFTYTPQFKIWLSSNYPVKGDVDDDAFWGRICVIRFPNSHLGHEDKTLKWRMADTENLPGILAWAVEGARRWYASPQGLTTPKAVQVATQKHRDELDHVQQWLDECTETLIGGATTNAALYSSYLHWCEENGHTPKKANAFGRALTAKGFETDSKKIAGRTARVYLNLAIAS